MAGARIYAGLNFILAPFDLVILYLQKTGTISWCCKKATKIAQKTLDFQGFFPGKKRLTQMAHFATIMT
jgi:hypothetical protein